MMAGIGALLFALSCTSSVLSFLMRPHSSPSTMACAAGQVLSYGGIQHAGILVDDSDKSKAFYMDVFGFTDETYQRPTTLPYPGAFLRCGTSQIHLMQLPTLDPKTGRPAHGGRDRHVALTVSNIDVLQKRLTDRQVPYTLSQGGRRAVFCRDLDGNAFEFVEDTSLGV